MADENIKDKKKTCTVYVEDWQMQCCGTPFKIGDSISWTVIEYSDSIGYRDQHCKSDFYYENHSSAQQSEQLYNLTATVVSIKACYYTVEYSPIEGKEKCQMGHWIYAKSIDVTEADGRDADIDGLQFGSYNVKLIDVSIEKIHSTGE
jgi:hypothetical protein